jgi:hypothetical protein
MQIDELQKNLKKDLRKQLLSARFVMDRFRVIDESSRKTAPYLDVNYAPFYYHLGKYLQSKSLVEIGFRLGLFSSCFLLGCKTVERVLGFQQESNETYNPVFGRKNVRTAYHGKLDIYVGKVLDRGFEKLITGNKWDVGIVNEELSYDIHREYLDLLWENTNLDGYIVADYIKKHEPARKAFEDFCKIHQRPVIVLPTRYGTGIVQR